MDDYIYEYNEDVFSEATLAMGASLAEVLLSQNMSPYEQVDWLDQIADWEDGLGDMDIAVTAVEQGWTYPPLVATMGENILVPHAAQHCSLGAHVLPSSFGFRFAWAFFPHR